MTPTRSLTFVLWLLASPLPVTAQPLQSFESLALRVNLDDHLRVEDQSGITATGRLTSLTRNEIAIRTDAGEKRFTNDQVRQVAVRGHSLGKSALIGAGVFAVLGTVAASIHGENAVAGPLGASAIGAGVGLAIGALVPRMKTIYRLPEGRTLLPRSREAIGVQPSLLEDVGLRVNLDDQLRIEDQSGVSTAGRLARLSDDDLTIQTDAGEKHFTRETVRQVSVRHSPIRQAVLIGAGVGAALGAAAGCTGPDRSECADGLIIAGGLGASVGFITGALIPRTTIVYPRPEKRTMMVPVIGRNTAGVMVHRRW